MKGQGLVGLPLGPPARARAHGPPMAPHGPPPNAYYAYYAYPTSSYSLYPVRVGTRSTRHGLPFYAFRRGEGSALV